MTFREALTERKAYIEKQGFNLIEKWECEIRRELKENTEMKTFFRQV